MEKNGKKSADMLKIEIRNIYIPIYVFLEPFQKSSEIKFGKTEEFNYNAKIQPKAKKRISIKKPQRSQK